MRDELQRCFAQKDWGDAELGISRSGPGSTAKRTEALRQALPRLFRALNVRTFLDAPCGDWNWMRLVDLSAIEYIGLDIVDEIVAQNAASYGSDRVRFESRDITSDPLPNADLMLVRDCLFHLRYVHIWSVFQNFIAADIPFLMATNHHRALVNGDLNQDGRYRELNLLLDPFVLEEPILSVVEPALGQRLPERSLGVWSKMQIERALAKV